MPRFIFTDLHEKLIMHYMMLTRQETKLSDSLLHLIRLHTRVKTEKEMKVLFEGYKRYAQTELADSIFQIEKLCECLGLSFEETISMGKIRDKEKRQEFGKRYPNDSWI